MKKMAIILVVTLSAGMSEASYDRKGRFFDEYTNANEYTNVVDEYTNKVDEYTNTAGAYANVVNEYTDEYTNNGQNQSNIDEYDQQVCDTAQPQAVSNAQLMLTSLAGKLLVYYLSLQQAASSYFQGLTNLLSQWFKNIS